MLIFKVKPDKLLVYMSEDKIIFFDLILPHLVVLIVSLISFVLMRVGF